VKRGAGLEAGGADWQPITYEGYAPGGVALLVECLTDNRNRAASEVRTAMTRGGGTMADPGSVAYLFNRKGVVLVPKGELTEDDVVGAVLDAGAEEVNDLGEAYEVICEAGDLHAVRVALDAAGIEIETTSSSRSERFGPSGPRSGPHRPSRRRSWTYRGPCRRSVAIRPRSARMGPGCGEGWRRQEGASARGRERRGQAGGRGRASPQALPHAPPGVSRRRAETRHRSLTSEHVFG